MVSPLFRRYWSQTHAIEKLSAVQQRALQSFRRGLEEGVYEFEEAPCLCGRRDGELLARRDRNALPVDTYLCACGVMRTSPRMTAHSLARFYAEDYRLLYGGSARASDEFFAEQIRHGQGIRDFVTEAVGERLDIAIFDVGCGAGGALVPFAEAGCRVFGCDTGQEYLERGRAAGLTLEHGGIETLARHGPADLAILSHFLEHLPDPRGSLEQLAGALASDALIYVELPGVFYIHRTYGDFMLFLQNAHLYHFTLTTLTALMTSAGFGLVKGDEHIHALFRKCSQRRVLPTEGQAAEIRRYLWMLELARASRALLAARLVGRLRRTMSSRAVELKRAVLSLRR